MRNMQQEIMGLDIAEERPVYVGQDKVLDERFKAVYNVDAKRTSAVVGKGYEIIQHRDVAEAILDSCKNLNIKSDVQIRSGNDRLVMDVDFPDAKIKLNQVGEEFTAGFRLMNSYNKTSGVIVAPRLIRLVCLNGMTVSSLNLASAFHYRHNQEMAKNFSGYMEKALKEVINSSNKLKSVVSAAMKDSIEWKLCKQLISKLMYGVHKHEEAIKDKLKGKEISRWELYNALTSYLTHDEQIRPNVELWMNRRAEKVLTTNYERLIAPIIEAQ